MAHRLPSRETRSCLLQWVRRPRTPVMIGVDRGEFADVFRFNGSDVRERRLCLPSSVARSNDVSFNGSDVRERRLWSGFLFLGEKTYAASMGPTSENAGYASSAEIISSSRMLQWVRRPRTPVMLIRSKSGNYSESFNGSDVRERRL